jgi:hypothetical protein
VYYSQDIIKGCLCVNVKCWLTDEMSERVLLGLGRSNFQRRVHRLINVVPQSAAAVMCSISMVCVYWTMGMLPPMLFFDGRYGGEEAAYPGWAPNLGGGLGKHYRKSASFKPDLLTKGIMNPHSLVGNFFWTYLCLFTMRKDGWDYWGLDR